MGFSFVALRRPPFGGVALNKGTLFSSNLRSGKTGKNTFVYKKISDEISARVLTRRPEQILQNH
jgi:hypothetical protein